MMEDVGTRYGRILAEVRRAELGLPADLRGITLVRLEQLWDDPAQRPRLEEALRPLVQAVGPLLQDAAALGTAACGEGR